MQLVDLSPDAGLRGLCLVLIGWIDEDGYLREDDAEICNSLDIAPDQLGPRWVVAGLNPAGIFARICAIV